MSGWGVFLAVLLGIVSGLKDIEIEKFKTERDMYKERLTEWKSED